MPVSQMSDSSNSGNAAPGLRRAPDFFPIRAEGFNFSTQKGLLTRCSLGPTDDRGFRPHESLDLAEIYNISHATWVANCRKVQLGAPVEHQIDG